VRLLGKLAEITDSGIPIHFFVGNHDMWMKNYLQQELNIPVYFEPREFEFNHKKFWIGHGDGLGPGDHGYKFMKKIFRSPVCQWLFGILPPYIGVGLANYLSRRSRTATGSADDKFYGEEGEWLITYCKDILKEQHYDYLIFGHRHLPIDFSLKEGSRYINLGDWIRYYTYAVFDGQKLKVILPSRSLPSRPLDAVASIRRSMSYLRWHSTTRDVLLSRCSLLQLLYVTASIHRCPRNSHPHHNLARESSPSRRTRA
jgi:UDP-2,3-diacylglucosamine hydrolase